MKKISFSRLFVAIAVAVGVAVTLLPACGGRCGAGSGILDFHPRREVVPWLDMSRSGFSRWGEPEAAPSLTLLQFSDLHGDAGNLERIVEFKNEYSEWIADAIHVGDAVYCYWDDPNPWDLVSGAEKVLNTVGNHDCWKGHLVWAQSRRPYDATAEEAFSLIMVGKNPSKPFIDNWNVQKPEGPLCYYYKDYPAERIRLVVLDCMHYDAAQDAWLAGVLADALSKGLTVVGAQHYPPQSGLDEIPGGFSDLDEDLTAIPSPVVETGDIARMEAARTSASDADLSGVPAGTSLRFDLPGAPQMECFYDAAFAAVDRFIEAGGTFACWLSGHTHLDHIGHVRGHSRQLMVIVDKSGEKDSYMQEARTRGTVLQDSFNLLTVNTSRKTLYVKRIGCTRDQYQRSKTYFTYNYSTGEVLTNE